MAQYIDKDDLVREIEKQRNAYISEPGKYRVLSRILSFIDTLEVKDVELTNEKIKWSPNKKQMEALKDMLKWNIGDFNYQKWMEVNSLYEDLTNSKLFDETDRQK